MDDLLMHIKCAPTNENDELNQCKYVMKGNIQCKYKPKYNGFCGIHKKKIGNEIDELISIETDPIIEIVKSTKVKDTKVKDTKIKNTKIKNTKIKNTKEKDASLTKSAQAYINTKKCVALTKSGNQCNNFSETDSDTCNVHRSYTTTIDDNICTAKTKKGKRCTRKKNNGSYCTQHS